MSNFYCGISRFQREKIAVSKSKFKMSFTLDKTYGTADFREYRIGSMVKKIRNNESYNDILEHMRLTSQLEYFFFTFIYSAWILICKEPTPANSVKLIWFSQHNFVSCCDSPDHITHCTSKYSKFYHTHNCLGNALCFTIAYHCYGHGRNVSQNPTSDISSKQTISNLNTWAIRSVESYSVIPNVSV